MCCCYYWLLNTEYHFALYMPQRVEKDGRLGVHCFDILCEFISLHLVRRVPTLRFQCGLRRRFSHGNLATVRVL